MTYVEELAAHYGQVRKRLWNGQYPDDPKPKPSPRPMEYSGNAAGDLWHGLNPKYIEGEELRGRDIINAVLRVTKVTKLDFLSHRRWRRYVEARQIAFWFMRHYTDYSLPQIGRLVGGRDHTTVLHGIYMVSRHPERFATRLRQTADLLNISLSTRR